MKNIVIITWNINEDTKMKILRWRYQWNMLTISSVSSVSSFYETNNISS
jgi:hypothetical protein